jgi:hypothetical protein
LTRINQDLFHQKETRGYGRPFVAACARVAVVIGVSDQLYGMPDVSGQIDLFNQEVYCPVFFRKPVTIGFSLQAPG